RLNEWSKSCELAAQFLNELAGMQRTPYAIRLRRAANAIVVAANEALFPMLMAVDRKRARENSLSISKLRGLLEFGERRLVEAVNHLSEAVCLSTSVSRILTHELIDDSSA